MNLVSLNEAEKVYIIHGVEVSFMAKLCIFSESTTSYVLFFLGKFPVRRSQSTRLQAFRIGNGHCEQR